DGTSSTARDSFRFDDCIEASLVRKNKSLRKDPRMCLNYLSGNALKIPAVLDLKPSGLPSCSYCWPGAPQTPGTFYAVIAANENRSQGETKST
ncbi:MAG: hypothetical protein ACRD37_05055, partial [Candidatus Acidiferrales bacterium]